jgi:hypothetical protein
MFDLPLQQTPDIGQHLALSLLRLSMLARSEGLDIRRRFDAVPTAKLANNGKSIARVKRRIEIIVVFE